MLQSEHLSRNIPLVCLYILAESQFCCIICVIYSSSFVLAAFVKWFEYDSECTAYLWLNCELSWCAYCDIPNETTEADLVTVYSGSSGTGTDMLGWLPSGYVTEWWCETHVQTCSVIESKCHQCCAVMGHCNEQCVAHIPEIGSNPLQTCQRHYYSTHTIWSAFDATGSYHCVINHIPELTINHIPRALLVNPTIWHPFEVITMPSIIPHARPSKAAISWPQHLACLWSGHQSYTKDSIPNIPRALHIDPYHLVCLWCNRKW